jgi:hypothetical protein
VSAVIISVLALALAVAAFWWVFLRRGVIVTPPPDTYAMPPGPTTRLRFPFVLLNTGATPMVVADLRLVVAGSHEFHWSSTRKKISPSMDDFLDAAAPFAIKGRDAVQLFAEFGQVPPEWRPEPGESYPVRLEAKDQTGQWRHVVEFEWWAPVRPDLMDSSVAHRNAAAGGPLL